MPGLGVAAPAAGDPDQPACPTSSEGTNGRRRRRDHRRHRRERVGELRRPRAIGLEHLASTIERERHESAHHRGPTRVQPELEARHHAEVPASSSQAPQQLRFVGAAARTTSIRRRSRPRPRSGCRHARPCLRINQPIPPPSVSPATPVCEIRPPVLASPSACVAASKSAQVAPAWAMAVRRLGIHLHVAHQREVQHDAVVARARARRGCARRCAPPAASPLSRAKRIDLHDVRRSSDTARSPPGRLSNAPFQIARDIVVRLVSGHDHHRRANLDLEPLPPRRRSRRFHRTASSEMIGRASSRGTGSARYVAASHVRVRACGVAAPVPPTGATARRSRPRARRRSGSGST